MLNLTTSRSGEMLLKEKIKICFSSPSRWYFLLTGILGPIIAISVIDLGLKFSYSLVLIVIISGIIGYALMRQRRKYYDDI